MKQFLRLILGLSVSWQAFATFYAPPLGIAKGGTHANSLSGNGLLLMNSGGTSVTSLLGATLGDLLSWNGTTWTSASPGATVCMSDWTSYSLVIHGTGSDPTLGTTAINTANWRRNGDSMEISYTVVQTAAGSSGSGDYLYPIPGGYTIDNSKVAIDTGTFNAPSVGSGQVNVSGAQVTVTVSAYDTTHLALLSMTGSPAYTSSTNYSFSNTNVVNTFFAKVPIVEWAGNALCNTGAAKPLFHASGTPTAACFNSSCAAIFSSLGTGGFDTASAYNTSTGEYIIPSSGYYQATCTLAVAAVYIAGQSTNLYLEQNTSPIAFVKTDGNTANGVATPSATVIFNATTSDSITCVPETNGSTPSFTGTAYQNYFEVHKL